MKDKLTAIKNHVTKHRAKYAAATTATVMTSLYIGKIVPEWYEFCEEQGVLDAWNNHLEEAI